MSRPQRDPAKKDHAIMFPNFSHQQDGGIHLSMDSEVHAENGEMKNNEMLKLVGWSYKSHLAFEVGTTCLDAVKKLDLVESGSVACKLHPANLQKTSMLHG